MSCREETISKFLDSLNIDSINDVRYIKKCFGSQYCICGQKIKNGYLFFNIKNQLQCIVGVRCLSHIADYLGWNKN